MSDVGSPANGSDNEGSRSPPIAPSQSGSVSVDVLAELVVWTRTKPKAGRGQGRETKSPPKRKDFKFTIGKGQETYVEFARQLLTVHGLEKYRVSSRRPFGMKILVPPDKAANKARDVDSLADWDKQVERILDAPHNLVTVYIDSKTIERSCKVRRDGGELSGSDSDGSDNADLATPFDSTGDTERDRLISKFHKKLFDLWKNASGVGMTFVPSKSGLLGEPYPITRAMEVEWIDYLIEGEATIKEPPQTDTFNPAHRQRILRPDRRVPEGNFFQTGGPPASDLGHLATILSLFRGSTAGENSLSTSISDPQTHSNTAITSVQRPTTPVPRSSATLTVIPESPVRPTPTKLPRFLDFAEKKLGVEGARLFEGPLNDEHYGPDVLEFAKEEDLQRLGIAAGDIIRLKRGASDWYRGPLAKRPRTGAGSELNTGPQDNVDAAVAEEQDGWSKQARVSFERRWKDGTEAKRFWGPGVAEYNGPRSEVWDETYHCECLGMMVPVPIGYAPVEAGTADDDDEMYS